MDVSEARLAANRLNAQKSTGPRTEQGKARSRANGTAHGLAGSGLVVAEAEREEVDRRVHALEADLAPRSTEGTALIRQMAALSVRAERAARQESAALARHVRHAVDDFDEARHEAADRLFESLQDDPRRALRRLRKSPEGVDRLLQAWRDLRSELGREVIAAWTAAHMVLAACLSGTKPDHARGGRIGALSRGVWGDFHALEPHEGGHLGEEGRQAWAKARLLERIEAEVAALEAHRETLDFAMIELDRLEAPERALFDPSKEATLARRYESEARRGFFRALKEYRRVEAEAAERAGAASPAPTAATRPAESASEVGSVRERGGEAAVGPSRSAAGPRFEESSVARDRDGRPLCIGRPAGRPR